jgi:hypothetical protein
MWYALLPEVKVLLRGELEQRPFWLNPGFIFIIKPKTEIN